jgi:hypothetical protein
MSPAIRYDGKAGKRQDDRKAAARAFGVEAACKEERPGRRIDVRVDEDGARIFVEFLSLVNAELSAVSQSLVILRRMQIHISWAKTRSKSIAG